MIAVLIVDHGSRQPEANEQLGALAALVQDLVGSSVLVRAAHMELAAPDMMAAFRECVGRGATEIIIHPYMLGPGRHASVDLPRLAALAAAPYAGVRWRVTDPLGVHPLIARVVLERCGLAAITPTGASPDRDRR